MRKLSVCLFYGLCVFTIVFSLFWMALPKLPLSQSPAGSETDPASPLSLAPGTLIRVTGIYTNLLPENDALRIKRGLVVNSPRELDLLLEDLGE